jgi:hypothetical protein
MTTKTVNFTVQLCTASVSIVASLVILIMILFSPGGLKSPYRRIIFGMSAGDVMHSLGIITGPFSPPKGTSWAPWATGSIQSCDFNGFVTVYGGLLIRLYLFFLCVYYFYKLSDATFSKTLEKMFHIFINLTVLAICIYNVVSENFNPVLGGGICSISPYPVGCWKTPEIAGECTRGNNSTTMRLVVNLIPLFCFAGIMVFTILIYRRALRVQRNWRKNYPTTREDESISYTSCCCWTNYEYDQRADETDADYLLRLDTRDTLIQASLYVSSFLLSYMPMLLNKIGAMFNLQYPEILRTIFISGFYPFNGFFNILIYTRIQTMQLRLHYPEISWIRCFLLVIKAGGEVPDEETDANALSLCCSSCQSHIPHDGISDISFESEEQSKKPSSGLRSIYSRVFVPSVKRDICITDEVNGEEDGDGAEKNSSIQITSGDRETPSFLQQFSSST